MKPILNLYHIAPDRLNLYGDRGNIMTLVKRAEWRGITVRVHEVNRIEGSDLHHADILFIGGGSDREQSLVTEELFSVKQELKGLIENGVSALMVCGGYQFLGSYYQTLEGEKLKGLDLLPFYTISKTPRLIGNVLLETPMGRVMGFENHGGRTYHQESSFGKVVKGHGNNGEDGKEGIIYKNLIGTYLHGPLLPKNPNVADRLLKNAFIRKGGFGEFPSLPDRLEEQAQTVFWNKTIEGSV